MLLEDEIQLRGTFDRAEANRWVLTLEAKAIPFRLDELDGQFALVVPSGSSEQAAHELAEQDREFAARPTAPQLDVTSGPARAGWAMGLLLIAYYFVTLRYPWLDQRGVASAEAVLRGHWEQLLTALTLHGDIGHVVGNAVASTVFAGAVAARFGAGLTSWLVLQSGLWGNLFTAVYYRANHHWLGASTAMFGALGILAGVRLIDRDPENTVRIRWQVFGAAPRRLKRPSRTLG